MTDPQITPTPAEQPLALRLARHSSGIGRFLFNLALIAIVYFLFTGGHWNFLFVLFAAAAVTWSKGLYEALAESHPWVFWVLLSFGGLVTLLGLYRAFSAGA